MRQTQVLHRLQELDLKTDKHRSRAREVITSLEKNDALLQAQAQVAALQATLRPQETRVTDLNLEIQTVTNQTAQLTERLYSGKVSNPKELKDLQDKIAERKRYHASLENDLLETMVTVEELQESMQVAVQQLNEIETSWDAEQKTLKRELQQLKQELNAVKADRTTVAQAVNAENMVLYQTLRAQKQGLAVARLEGDVCSRCKIGQTTTLAQKVRQGQGLVLCSSCGRILVAV